MRRTSPCSRWPGGPGPVRNCFSVVPCFASRAPLSPACWHVLALHESCPLPCLLHQCRVVCSSFVASSSHLDASLLLLCRSLAVSSGLELVLLFRLPRETRRIVLRRAAGNALPDRAAVEGLSGGSGPQTTLHSTFVACLLACFDGAFLDATSVRVRCLLLSFSRSEAVRVGVTCWLLLPCGLRLTACFVVRFAADLGGVRQRQRAGAAAAGGE